MIIEGHTSTQCIKYWVFFMVIIFGCKKDKALDYYSYLPDQINKSSIININKGDLERDTIEIDLWYSNRQDSLFLLSQISDIEVVDLDIWISDLKNGTLLRFDHKGMFKEKLIERGKGPGEVLSPSAIEQITSEEGKFIYLIDAEQKMILTLNKLGVEINRLYTSSVEDRMINIGFKVLNENTFVYQNYLNKDYTLFEFDSLGEIKNKVVKRIVPIGYQPISYNDLVFDYSKDHKNLVYAYRGLPIFTIKKNNKFISYNLDSEKEIEEINAPLTFKPFNEVVSVKHLIKGIHFLDELIIIQYNNEFYQFDLIRNEIKRILIFKEVNSNRIVTPHFSVVSSGSLFLINAFRSDIYKISLSDL